MLSKRSRAILAVAVILYCNLLFAESFRFTVSADNTPYDESNKNRFEWVIDEIDRIFADGQGYYKYMWWGMQRDAQDYDFIALGNHGQFIYISPGKELIVLRFGEAYGEFGGAQGWVDMFYEYAAAVGG